MIKADSDTHKVYIVFYCTGHKNIHKETIWNQIFLSYWGADFTENVLSWS